jgi:hypothetical protein
MIVFRFLLSKKDANNMVFKNYVVFKVTRAEHLDCFTHACVLCKVNRTYSIRGKGSGRMRGSRESSPRARIGREGRSFDGDGNGGSTEEGPIRPG